MGFKIQLLPQEDVFYELIGESGELAYASVKLLHELVQADDAARIDKLGEDIKQTKDKAKRVVQDVTEKLCQTFVTPLDREDIHALAVMLYKIPKIAEKTQERLRAFNLRPLDGDLTRLTHNMVEAADNLQFLMRHLKNFKDSQVVNEKCAALNHIEGVTDDLLSDLLVELFQKEADVKQVILRKDVYNLMEKIVDRHRDISKLILEIVLKHS